MPVTTQVDLNFESTNEWNALGILDVFAPEQHGAWPVVVMFHGDPGSDDRRYLGVYGERLAGEGFVVFVPNWGKSGGTDYDALTFSGQAELDMAQAACAVAFARARASDFGGDPSRIIVFGHSAGGNAASMVIFARPTPTAGCLGGAELGAVDRLVSWEGDWLLAAPFLDSILAGDPAAFNSLTPWNHLAEQPQVAVHFVVSDNPGLGRQDGTWIEDRDPAGGVRRIADALGALDDDYFGLGEMQEVFARMLDDAGIAQTLSVMIGSTHQSISDEAWPVFVDAFRDAAN